jgi:phenylalanyl-tRNA synthetase beta chain
MPTIHVDLEDLRRLVGDDYDLAGLGRDLELVKGELKAADPATGRHRIELNDTNRPDLWSAAGIARQIRCARDGGARPYPCFEAPAGAAAIEVDPRARHIRPFVGGFVAHGPAVTDASLAELIQSQEKLCEGFGAKRRTISMGIYRAEKVRFPVRFRMVEPGSVAFVPLGLQDQLTLREILQVHPKGLEYGAILAQAPLYPLLEDSAGGILSFPPIINSRDIGEVVAGDRELFVECTGLDHRMMLLVLNIMAADLTDRGYAIEPATVRYPYRTAYGREVKVPYALPNRVSVPRREFERLLGIALEPDRIARLLRSYGCAVELSRSRIKVATGPYRQDYLHPVDAVEDLAIAMGLNSFEPVWPERFTPGHLAPLTLLEDRVRELMIGLGYEEIIANVLGSAEELGQRLRQKDPPMVRIANVMSESYAVLRWTLLASLLAVEQHSMKTAYPHWIFEVGELAVGDPDDPHGARTESVLGALAAHPGANFSELHSVLNYVLFYLGYQAELRPVERPSFLAGRGAEIWIGERRVGHLGELHPELLELWGLKMPASYLELALPPLLPA